MSTSSRGLGPQRHVSLARPLRRTSRRGRLEEIPVERRVESFADDLNTRLGIVSGRVALLPRSTEIQPKSLRFGPSPNSARRFQRGPAWVPCEDRRGQVLEHTWASPGQSVGKAVAKCGQSPWEGLVTWARRWHGLPPLGRVHGKAWARVVRRLGNLGHGPGKFRERCRFAEKDPGWCDS